MPARTTPEPVDVLLVSPGTTAGWRRIDSSLASILAELGLSVATATSDYRIVRHLRRTMLLTDLAEAAAMRRAVTKALRLRRPRAIVYSSSQATMLQPAARLGGATAVRFDEPAALNRSGPGARALHALERRALAQVRLLLPLGLEPSFDSRALRIQTPIVALPVPIELSRAGSPEPIVLTYAGNPEKKGLDLAMGAWARADPDDFTLVVTGLSGERGRRWLARRGISEPRGVEWAGMVSGERYRELLASAAAYLSASRHEDYGLAQLEALGAGVPLVAVPASGSYEAFRYAAALDERLIVRERAARALAGALETALSLSQSERASYAERAHELIRPYSRDELRRRVSERVLPVLLGST
jgi:glycosyltransferase involved in cell wall biosynthesis